jgi:hypothetical protein
MVWSGRSNSDRRQRRRWFTAYYAAPAWPDYDKSLAFQGLQRAACGLAASRCRAWAHMLGYGGHFLTKSRRYSVTFGQLRAARTDHRRASRPTDADRDAWGRPLDETVVLVLPVIWTYEGTGCSIAAAAELALAAAARAREHHGQADNAA